MNFTMITPHHNHGKGYISLIIKDKLRLPDQVRVDDITLTKKSEFHVSLLALKHIAPMVNPEEPGPIMQQIVHDFIQFQKTTDLSRYVLSNTYRYVKRDIRESIIVMVEVPNIEKLFSYLSNKYQVDIPYQPTHITLYTLQPEAGIGIFSKIELERDSKLILSSEVVPALYIR